MLIKTHIILLLCCLFPLGICAQGQGDVWFFGDSVILDFNAGSPVVRTNTTMTSEESSSVLSTLDGELLLYTNGWQLFDSTGNTFANWVIPNGGYLGSQTVVQGNLLLPINDSILYFIAMSGSPTSGSHNGIYYARLNLRANNGQGTVEASHINIADSVTEHMAAVRDADNRGWWLLSHKTTSDKFIKWHILEDGTMTKSFQAIGGVHPPLWVLYTGQMVFGPNGDRMIIASERGRLEYYNFDRCDGSLSLLNTLQKSIVDTNNFFGKSFSPNGRFIYSSDGIFSGAQSNALSSKLYQYEIDAPDILATEKLIWETPICDSCTRSIGHHKLGPDGKIYIVHSIADFHQEVRDTLMVINSPDSIGQACDFDAHGLVVAPGKTRYGLPNIPNYHIKPLMGQVAEAGPDILLCGGDSVQIGVPDSMATHVFQWQPAAGLSNPNVAQPMASPAFATTYYLTVVDTSINIACNSTFDSVRIELVDPLLPRPSADAGRDTLVCAGAAVLLGRADTSSGAWAYAWSPSAGLNDANIAQPTAMVQASVEYVLHVFRPEVSGHCQEAFDTVSVAVFDVNTLPQKPAGNDTVICIGDTLQVGNSAGSYLYAWTGADFVNPFAAQAVLSPSTSRDVMLVLTDTTVVGGCGTVRDTVHISVEQPFMHEAPRDQSFCAGECFEIGVAGQSGFLYNWSPTAGLRNPDQSLTQAQPLWTTVYTLEITDPLLQSANCRVQNYTINVVADACNYQTFIAHNGNGIAEVLDFGAHAGALELAVFDVQGRLVYRNSDYGNDWDASALGHGLYVYRLHVAGACGWDYVGKVMVLR